MELTVTDSGMGIPESDLPNIFDRFFRGDKSRERHGAIKGTGLGLSICEAIVTEHGGTITVRSQVGHGTTFTVLLPVAKKEES